MADALPRRTIGAGLAGNVLEWYDFAVYGYLAPVIAAKFFPADDPVASLIAAYGAFAAGFLARPFGGLVFGYVGDRFGRKRALSLSVILMALPTTAIGIMPGHAELGVLAPAAMVLLRILQGLSAGGEYTTSVVFLAEHAPTARRGFAASFAVFGAVGGILLGSAAGALVHTVWDAETVAAWAWRVPFVCGLVVAFAGYLIRRHTEEPPGRPPAESPLRAAVRTAWRPMLAVAGTNAVNAVGFYMLFVYITTFLLRQVKIPASEALDINTASMAVLLLVIPFAGALSDRIGRRVQLMAATALVLTGAYPLLWLMHHPDPVLILAGQMGFAVLLGLYFGAQPAYTAELLPRGVRCSGFAVAYNLVLGVLGGTVPMVATYLIDRTHDDLSIAWYLAGAAAISLATVASQRQPEETAAAAPA